MLLPNIKKFFIHSEYYKNCKELPINVLSEYENIKNYYKESKIKLNNEMKIMLFDFIHQFFIYNVEDKYLEDYILFLIENYTFNEINIEILKLTDSLVDKIYNLDAIKLLLDDTIQDEELIYKNCSPEYYIKNKLECKKLKNNIRMQEFFKKTKSYDKILKEKSKLKSDSNKYLNRFTNLDNALMCASRYGNKNHVKSLIEKGANVHTDNNNSLTLACKNGHFKIVKILIENGASILDCETNNTLELTCKNGHSKIIKFLIDNGSDICGYHECVLTRSCEYGNIEIVKYLIEKNTLKYPEFDRAFNYSCKNGNIELVKLLINKVDNYTLNRCIENVKYYKNDELFNFLKKNDTNDNILF